MTIEWNKVTWYSKLLAVILFVLTFAAAFYFGKEFQKIKDIKVVESPYVPSKPRDLVLKVGDKAVSGDLKVAFVSVSQDSRCPADVECIQAGNVKLNVALEIDKVKENREMVSDYTAYEFQGYSILIKDVKPAKHSEAGEIPQKDYVVTFHVEKMN